jgi:hypothetical protein
VKATRHTTVQPLPPPALFILPCIQKLAALEGQLDAKIREVASLREASSNSEAAHARDLEVRHSFRCMALMAQPIRRVLPRQALILRAHEKEQECARLRDEVQAGSDAVESMKSQVEEARRRADEDSKKAVERALEKARKDKAAANSGLDEAAAAELRTKLEAAQVGMLVQIRSNIHVSSLERDVSFSVASWYTVSFLSLSSCRTLFVAFLSHLQRLLSRSLLRRRMLVPCGRA